MLDIEKYKGLNILNKLKTNAEKGVYKANWDQLYKNYGDNVDWQRLREQIYLCKETRDYLYSTPGKVKYVKGTRPIIDAVVEYVTKNASNDREKVLSLLLYGRDLYLTHGKHIPYNFYGGTEEQLIEKGENLCECMGRLMVSLCEAAGYPGRIIMHIVNGHITCEIYIEDKWCFFDPRFAVFYVDKDNKILSVEEIMANRSVVFEQPEWVKKYVSAQTSYEKMANNNYNRYMHSNEIQCYCDYSLMDYNLYTYNTLLENVPEKMGIREPQQRYAMYQKQIMG